MGGEPLDQAFDASRESMFFPPDDLEVAVTVFSKDMLHWPGMEGTPGWGRLPDQRVKDSIELFLNENKVSGGDTLVCPPLIHALDQKVDEQGVSILLITDGVFSDAQMLNLSVSFAQSLRKHRAAIFCLMIGTHDRTFLENLTEANGGRVF